MKKLICLIEKDTHFADTLEKQLNALGFEVFFYPSGEAYLEDHDQGLNALYMIGLNLPGMNGKELVKRIRLTSQLVPIHILSQEEDSHQVMDALSAGADYFLTKPFDMNELLVRVNSAWNKFMLLTDRKINRSVDTSL